MNPDYFNRDLSRLNSSNLQKASFLSSLRSSVASRVLPLLVSAGVVACTDRVQAPVSNDMSVSENQMDMELPDMGGEEPDMETPDMGGEMADMEMPDMGGEMADMEMPDMGGEMADMGGEMADMEMAGEEPDMELNNDRDGDGVSNDIETQCGSDPDNAASTPNDADGDAVCDGVDNCSDVANTDQANLDGDEEGDACDEDDDNDGFTDANENECGSDPRNAASTPLDSDVDGTCDALEVDPDTDGDGVVDSQDDCTFVVGSVNGCPDSDNDGVADLSDNCPSVPNQNQADLDLDGQGDACDQDDDNDTFTDDNEVACASDPRNAASTPLDSDSDGTCDALDADRDGDGASNDEETQCGTNPDDENSVPVDTDGDGICDALDADRDGDGVVNADDLCPDTIGDDNYGCCQLDLESYLENSRSTSLSEFLSVNSDNARLVSTGSFLDIVLYSDSELTCQSATYSDNGINFYNVVPFENNQCLINDVTVMVTDAQASFGLKYNLSTQMVVLYELSSLNTVVLQDGSRYNLWSGPEVGSIDLSQNPIEVEGCGAIRPGLREQIIAALNSMM